MKGFIYVLSHKAMPNLHKIGYTTRTVDDRINELSSTGVPGKFIAEIYFHVENAPLAEELIHKLLNQFIYEKEFFHTDLITIVSVIHKLRENGTLQISEFHGRSKNKALSDIDKEKIAQEIVDANKFAEDEFNEFINLKYHELKIIQKTLYENLARFDSNYYKYQRKMDIVKKHIKILDAEKNRKLQKEYKIEEKLYEKDRLIFDSYADSLMRNGIIINNIIKNDDKKRFFKTINLDSFARGEKIILSSEDRKVIYHFLEIYLKIYKLRCDGFEQYTYGFNLNKLERIFIGCKIKNRTNIFDGLINNFIIETFIEGGEKSNFAMHVKFSLFKK